MKTTKYILTLVLTAWCAWGTLYAVEKSYYNSVDGKSGTALREALTTLTYTKHTTDLGYDWTFDGIDIVNGEILDIYSTCSWSSSQQGKSYSNICDGYNREHVVPQSLFHEAAPQKGDRHHLFLTDGQVNNLRSSYPFGETNVTTAFSGYSNGNKALGKLGTASSGYSGTVYEPDDEYKGDIARAVLYMVVRYATSDVCRKYGGSANSYPVTTWDNAMFSKNLSTNYGLSNNAIAVFLKWHRNDPVSAKEIARNNGVEKKQGNRNPFIDLPDLVEYLWGNHAGETVNLSSLDIATGGGSAITTYEVTLNRNGAEQTITCSGSYTLPTSATEVDACEGWTFAGWSTNSSVNTTTAPSFKTSVSSATTLYAVYSNTTSSSAPIHKTNAAVNDVLWGEDFSGFSANDVPSASNASTVVYSGSITYSVDNGGGTTKVYNESTGGGTAPEILIAKSNGALTASGIPTGGATEMTLTFVSNRTTFSVTTTSENLTVSGSGKSWTISVKSGKTTPETFDLTIKNTGSSNSRVDDISLKVKTAGTGGGGGSTTTYKTSPECGTSHDITLSSGGSVTGGTFEANVTSAYAGATITLYAEPISGYTFGSWTVTNNSTSATISVTDNQFTMPDADVTVSTTFTALPTYNIKFYKNGTQIGSTQSVYQGGVPDVPVVEGCEGYTFIGWWTSALATTNTEAKSWIEDFTVSKTQDYYAVFSHTTDGGGSTNGTKTFTFSSIATANSWENGVAYTEVVDAPVTIIASGGGNNGKWYSSSGGSWRMYSGGTVNISVTSGSVTSVTSSPNCTFTISNGSASYSPSARTDYTSITVNYTAAGGGTTYYTSTTDCPSACTKLDAPAVTATPGNGQITLTWADVTDADHYTVTIGTGVGYTTECGSAASIGTITHSGTTNTCIITGLTNGLTYTTNVVANASSSTCDSDADSDSATPQDCTPWDDPTLSWNKYSLNTTADKTATKTLSGTTHGSLSFESSNTDVLSVNGSTGAVTAVGAGKATVIARWTAASGYCEKTMTSSTFEVAGPLTISFDANGGSGTMTDQTVTYKVATAIKDNAFSREGYSFIGWATSADGEKVYNDKQSVAFTNSLTLYAKWQLNSHTVSFTSSITGATVTVNGQSTNQTVEYGATVTVHIAPAAHYTISSVSIQGATSLTEITQTGSGETRTFTMPDENVIVAVSMGAESQYTATFYNNGTQYGEAQTSYADDDINAPATNPVSCDEDEFTFVGWVAAEQTSETTSMPEVLTFPQAMPVGNVSFYALYRRVEGSGGGEASVTFKTASSDGNAAYTTDSEIKTNLVESYSGIASFAGERAYSGKNGVKLGASGGVGYITLNLSSPITPNTITVNAVQYSTDTGKLQVEVNGSNSFGSALSPADGTLTFTNASEVEISDLTISTTTKRAYIASISLGGGGTSYYTTAPECTPCDYHVTLTKGAESHGTFTLNKADGAYDNCKTNFIVTVSGITPDDGYYCSGVTATGGSHAIVAGPDGSGNYTVSYTKDNTIETTITAIFNQIPTYTVTWSSNGDTGNQDSYKEGEAIIFPPSASGCDGKVFMGWSAVEVAEQDEAPEYTTSAVMGNSDITYYAVFATAGTGGSGGELLNETFDNELSSDATTEFADNTFANFPTGNSKAYKGAGGTIKLGSGSASGHITSKNLDLSSAFTVSLAAKYYNTGGDNANINIIVDWGETSEQTKTITKDELTGSFKNFSFNFTAASSTSQVRIETSTKRAYIDNVVITSGSGTTYSGYTTSCTECLTKVTIEKGVESHGEFTLNKADGAYNNCAANFVVIVSGITHESGYHCTGVTATGGYNTVAGPDGSGNYTVTYEKGYSIESTITANFEPNPTYAVTWSMDGDESTKVYYEEGQEIAFPTSATGCEDKTFMGWTATAIANPQAEAPTYVTSATMSTSPITYYAVYAEEDEGGSSSGSGDYELVESDLSNWAGDYLIAYNDEIFADGRIGGTDAGAIGKQNTSVDPGENLSGKVVAGSWGDTYNVTIVESDTEGKYLLKTKDGKYNYHTSNSSNGLSATEYKATAEGYPLSITFNSSEDIAIAIEAGAVLHYNASGYFRFYQNGSQNNVYLYRKGGGGGINYTNYTTTCGAAINAKNIGWITAAQGQKVKRVINVSAKGFDEATTLSATSGDAQFKVTLGASAVPAGKTGLSTTLTVEYTPTVSDNRVANVEIVLSAGSITKTITASGRSLPDEFLAITKKNDTWYALPANMTGGENQYEGVVVTPDNDSEPTMVAVAPSTIVYGLRSADNSRYAENGAYVRLAGNGGKALWGNTTANAVTIQNSETVNSANTENYEWSLHTTDGVHYTIANPHHADYASGRVLAFGDKFGLYKTATVFFLVPTGCNSQPLEVNVSARRVDATFSWISNASSVTIDLYTDEEKTAFATSATVTSVPYYMTGLEESTHYWFTLTPDGEDACAVSGEFETTGPTIDVVEWKDESVIVSVDKDDEFHPSIVIDGEVEHGAGTGRVADELFFSKYFEGSGSMKLVAIFNGTKEDINLTNYTIFVRMRGSAGSWSGSTNDVTLNLSGLGSIASGQEIIFFSRPLGTEAALASCSNTFLDDKVTNSSSAESNPRWVECNGTTYKRINFNGNDPILLRKSGTTIDIIGSESDTAPTTKNCLTNDNEKGWSGTVKNMDKGKSPSDPVFDAFYEASSKTPVTTQDSIDLLADFGINLTADEIGITTARCILFRDKRVVSGDSAVLMNGETFVTFTNHDTFKSEWTGRAVCMDDDMQDDAGVDNDAQATCNSYQDLSNFDYSEYYKDWTTIDEQKLDDYIKDPEAGTYEILIPNLAKYSCLNIRFQLKNDAEEVVTEAPVQVPIIVKGGHTTIDAIFNEIIKKDDETHAPLYDESIKRCKTCDVVVLSDGVLTKAIDGSLHDVPEVGNVKVYPGGKLIVPPETSYSVNSLAFRRQEDEVSTADIQGDLDIKADGNNVYLDLRIDPSNWHYISLPYNCNVSDIRFAGDEMKIPILGTDYLLKYYDGEKRAATQAGGCWEMVAPDATLRKGIGYIFGIPGEGKVKREFRFPMSNTIITEEKNPEGKIASGVYAFGGDKSMTEVRANHRGWNLIGDPYLLPYSSDIADPVITGYIVPDYPEDQEAQWDGHYKFADDARSDLRYIVEPVDNGRSEYIQVPIIAYEMKPFTSYFVQIGGSNPEAEQGVQFHLSAVDRSASPVRRAPAEYAEEQEDKHPVWCAVTITSPKGEKDETTMLISDQFTDGYDMMDDLVKMRGTYYQYAQITTKPVLASRNNEGEMAFNALPDASAEAGIPLHYFAATQGEYVIAYSDKYGSEEIQAVMLLDKQLNEWHDLMNEPYTFYTNRTDDKNRFILTVRVDRRKEPQIATDTDAASSTDDRPRKILHNDHIYILRGDRIYDITGKQMLNR